MKHSISEAIKDSLKHFDLSGGIDMKGIYYNYDIEECNWMFKHSIQPI